MPGKTASSSYPSSWIQRKSTTMTLYHSFKRRCNGKKSAEACFLQKMKEFSDCSNVTVAFDNVILSTYFCRWHQVLNEQHPPKIAIASTYLVMRCNQALNCIFRDCKPGLMVSQGWVLPTQLTHKANYSS